MQFQLDLPTPPKQHDDDDAPTSNWNCEMCYFLVVLNVCNIFKNFNKNALC